MKVLHKIAPVWDCKSRVLILGTMPSPASRAAGFFYMHAQNRFWTVMATVFGEVFRFKNNAPERSEAVRERRDFLLRHGIALWDVLSECSIDGAADATIKNAVPNDFTRIFAGADIKQVFCTGKTAFALYEKHCAHKYAVPCAYLPSTSPANRARWPEEKLAAEYERVKNIL
ncbi:MAG: DNA-deoxyinosine glycosylase [Treponema sp.]